MRSGHSSTLDREAASLRQTPQGPEREAPGSSCSALPLLDSRCCQTKPLRHPLLSQTELRSQRLDLDAIHDAQLINITRIFQLVPVGSMSYNITCKDIW